MNNPPVQFKFALGDHVIIVPLHNLVGVVLGRAERGDGTQDYRVVYWSNGERKDTWLFEFELELAPAEKGTPTW